MERNYSRSLHVKNIYVTKLASVSQNQSWEFYAQCLQKVNQTAAIDFKNEISKLN